MGSISIIVPAFAYIFVIISYLKPTAGACDAATGPSGTLVCIYSSRYTYPQWATCLTDRYIRQKSRGKHSCISSSRTYCYYQCMLEVHGKGSGSVSNDCQCTIGATTPPTSLPQPTLPPWCNSPSGRDCTWYRACLEKRYPCSGKPGDYGIAYAETFCNLYSTSRYKFSSQGRNWIDAVRKCLQVALVPMLRPFGNPTCQKIRDTAFKSHTSCYLKPYPGAPSICDLTIKDWWRIFWVIKSAFTQAFRESINGILQTMKGCGKSIIKESYDDAVKQIQLTMTVVKNKSRRKRNIRYVSTGDNKLAGAAAESIAKQLNWDNRVMDWFAYADTTNPNKFIQFRILLGNKYAVGLVNKSDGFPSLVLNDTVNHFVIAVQNGTLRMKKKRNAWSSEELILTSVAACSGILCRETYLNAKAQPPSHAVSAKANQFILISALMICFNVMFGIFG